MTTEFFNYVDYEISALGGKISPSLINLKYLYYLDLSYNNFGGIPIPNFIGSLQSLRYLNISESGFGRDFHLLGNLSNLHILDLSGVGKIDNLGWLTGLSNLEKLDISRVNLSKASNWLHQISMIPCLRKLHLSQCNLHQISHHHHPNSLNFSSLVLLDLSSNYDLKSSIPRWVFGLRNLRYLDLSSCNFEGQLPDGPWNITSLSYLNLGYNYLINGRNFPKGLFNLHNLVYLNLRGNHFHGSLPEGIRNLSSLETLDVSGNHLNSSLPQELFTLKDLVSLDLFDNSFSGSIPSNLCNSTKLKYLDISSNGFNSSIPRGLYKCKRLELLNFRENWLQGVISNEIGNLTSLIKMDLTYNAITGGVPREIGNLCKLEFLSLSGNGMKGSISKIIDDISICASDSLEVLFLSENFFSGQLTDKLQKFKNLRSLDLDENAISGPIPSTLGKLSSLEELQLNGNKLNGTIPESFWQLSKLNILLISDNLLEGEVTEYQLDNLTSLTVLSASRNSLVLKVNPNWTPLSKFRRLELGSWNIGSQFPLWLQSVKTMAILDLSSTGISGAFPSWFWNFSQQISHLNFAHNHLLGEISSIPISEEIMQDPRLIYLSSNQFSGPLPQLPSNGTSELDLYNNSFTGDISTFLCDVVEGQKLKILNLGSNLLFGKIPDCWMNWPLLIVINLANNNFTGSIPKSIGHLKYLKSLDLHNNNLSGQIPLTLKNCRELLKIDLGQNYLSENFPAWLGSSLPRLRILILRSNKFHANLAPEICFLTFLHIMDIAENNISGKIPNCFNNFTFMTGKMIDSDNDEMIKMDYSYYIGVYSESASIATKGNKNMYESGTLSLLTSMDLSNNNFSGNIPEELIDLVGLKSLNISGNHLSGNIPENIGQMRQVESLDLSRNLLSGEIPQSIAEMSFLEVLNLSYNNLSGKIPLSTQMQSFNASSFIGNKLCGLPLANGCRTEDVAVMFDKNATFEVNWLYIFMGLGYVVGLWGFLGVLIFKRSWRHSYFRFIHDVWDRLYFLIK
ncbi:hypothetical protein M9H77_33688 [Catharanthus roseus]|uniref:Uncharacterized protein n=1 Tax=Catharanthus roseus TaxID=4058 RepID=A0ACB9ZJU6_CATRO|nr:hypothetical protein M9H77_33688 [Catharanthus roseus]